MITCIQKDKFIYLEVKESPFSKWANLNNIGLDWVSQLVAEDKAKVEEQGVLVPTIELVSFPSSVLKKLGLPEILPYELKLETSGSLLSKDLELNYFLVKKSRPVIGGKIDGCFFEKGDKTYFINEPIYSSIMILEKFKNEKDQDERLRLINDLKVVLPADVFAKDFRLKAFNLIQATKLTLDITDHENFIISPELILPEEDEVSLLTPEQNENFKHQFNKLNKASRKYRVNDNSFVLLDQVLHDVCKEIKEVNQKTSAERRDIYFNPKKYFKEKLGSLYTDEIIEEILVENELFSSNRISHIGIWEPKVHAYVPKGKNNWIPKDCVTIKVDESFIYVDPDDLENIISKVETARKENKDIITLGGVTVENNDVLLNELKGCLKGFEKIEKETSKLKDPPKNRKEALQKYVAIIKDNIDTNEYAEAEREQISLDESLPQILRTKSLYDYQQIGVNWLQKSYQHGQRGVLLADDMGLGKTLQTLTFLAWLREHMENGTIDKKPILIVGPTGLLQNWKDEHNTHLYDPGLGECVEGFGKRLKAIKSLAYNESVRLLEQADWVLTTYDTLRDQEKYFRAIKWACIVFDEAQAIKKPSSLKTDMAKAMDADFSIAVTGTPVENTLCDLWCISDAVYPGKLGLYKNFKEKYEKSEDNHDELKDILVKTQPAFMLRRLKEGNLSGLPKRTFQIKNKEMPSEQLSLYNAILDNVKKGAYEKAQFQAIHDLKRASLYDPNLVQEGAEALIGASARLQLLLETLDEIKGRGEKVLIFLENREVQTVLIPYLQRKYDLRTPPLLINGAIDGKLRKAKVDDFQSRQDGFDIMVISPKAGGTGLTITKANNVIHLDRWWNPAVEDQCNDRCYRIGQEKEVNVYVLLAKHPELGDESFDFIMHSILENKRQLSRDVIVPPHLSKKEMQEFYTQVTGKNIEFQDTKDEFYLTDAWKRLRLRAIAQYGLRCMKCSAINVEMHVDHIKPRSKYPEMELVFNNLQVLCRKCNLEKSNVDETDYRPR